MIFPTDKHFGPVGVDQERSEWNTTVGRQEKCREASLLLSMGFLCVASVHKCKWGYKHDLCKEFVFYIYYNAAIADRITLPQNTDS
jgi:hypothetical protein